MSWSCAPFLCSTQHHTLVSMDSCASSCGIAPLALWMVDNYRHFPGKSVGSLQMNKGSSHGPTGNHYNTTLSFLYIPVRWSDGQ